MAHWVWGGGFLAKLGVDFAEVKQFLLYRCIWSYGMYFAWQTPWCSKGLMLLY